MSEKKEDFSFFPDARIPKEIENCLDSLGENLFSLIQKSRLSREETFSGVKMLLQGIYLLGKNHGKKENPRMPTPETDCSDSPWFDSKI